MNRDLAKAVLTKGKALAPDRFPSIPAGEREQRIMLDAWGEALGTVPAPAQAWSEALTVWSTEMAGERMATPRELCAAVKVVVKRWESDPQKFQALESWRMERLNANYRRMGLEPVPSTAKIASSEHRRRMVEAFAESVAGRTVAQ